jgi:poly(hydroxyalkanoate) depolymerase family esterase
MLAVMHAPAKILASITLAAATLLIAPSPSHAASWKTNVSYGANTIMDLYVPDNVAASPAVVVALHYCSGNAGSAHSWFQSLADSRHFIIIAPGAGGNCFDAGLGRSGERANIVKMVQYVQTMYNADPKRVFSVGASSGACMTQALLASYPDVFAAGSSLAGVPAGAWNGGNAYGWSMTSMTAQQWGDKVRNADPGFSGMRPRVQLWQGMGDTTLTYSIAYPAEVAQWTNVFGVSGGTMESIKPSGAKSTWARTSYKDSAGVLVVEANSGPNTVPHDLTPEGLYGDVIRFFGLDTDATGTGGAGGATGAGGAGGRGGSTGAAGRGGAGGVTGAGGSVAGAGGRGGTTGAGGATGAGGTTSGTGGRGGNTNTSGAGGEAGTSGGAGSTGTTGAAGTTGSAGTSGGAGNVGTTGAAGNGSGEAGTTGATGTGGAGPGTGTGGNTGGGGTGTPGETDPSGCACAVTPDAPHGGLAALALAALALIRRRRRS